MAKAAKPERTLYHATERPSLNPQKTKGRRKRMALTTKVENMTEDRWKKVLAATADGCNRAEAARAANISPQTIEAYLISNVVAYKQLRDSQLIYLRSQWSSDELDQVFNLLASGLSLKKSCEQLDKTESNYKGLIALARKDKAIREQYDIAREIWAETFLDDTIDIADDSENDRLENGRINHEVVNRSKLRIEARWRAMGAMVKKRFGEHKHHEHEGNIQVNHIAMLTGARKRVEGRDRDLPPIKESVTVDNDTGEISE